MRVNFLILVWIMAAAAVTQLLRGEYLAGVLSAGLSVAFFFIHRKRIRQFKEFDQKRTFD